MADYRVNQLLSLINQQLESRENLSEYLSKAEALACVTLNDNFLDSPKLIVHNYLWTLNDIVEQARKVNEHSLNTLLKKQYLGPDYNVTI